MMKSEAYLKAKRKVEILKDFYNHLVVYIIINSVIILVLSNTFGNGKPDFLKWENYVTTFFWGIGLVSHAVYVLFTLYGRNRFLKRWEEKKIKQFMDEERF